MIRSNHSRYHNHCESYCTLLNTALSNLFMQQPEENCIYWYCHMNLISVRHCFDFPEIHGSVLHWIVYMYFKMK